MQLTHLNGTLSVRSSPRLSVRINTALALTPPLRRHHTSQKRVAQSKRVIFHFCTRVPAQCTSHITYGTNLTNNQPIQPVMLCRAPKAAKFCSSPKVAKSRVLVSCIASTLPQPQTIAKISAQSPPLFQQARNASPIIVVHQSLPRSRAGSSWHHCCQTFCAVAQLRYN